MNNLRKAPGEKKKFSSVFIVRVSDNFYNKSEANIQKEKNKMKLVKQFIKDIQKEPDLTHTPSMAVHKILLRSQPKIQIESLRHMNSMQDLKTTPQAKEVGSTKSSAQFQSARRGSFSGYVSSSIGSQTLIESGKQVQPSPFARQQASSQRAVAVLAREPQQVERTRTRIISEAETKIKTIMDGSDARVNCTVCVEKASDAVYEPCFHGGVCASCAVHCYQKDEQHKCPICREVAPSHPAHPENIQDRNEGDSADQNRRGHHSRQEAEKTARPVLHRGRRGQLRRSRGRGVEEKLRTAAFDRQPFSGPAQNPRAATTQSCDGEFPP